MREVTRLAFGLTMLASLACSDAASRRASSLAVEATGGPELAPSFPRGLSGRLVFQSDREGSNKIYVLDLTSRQLTRLTHGTQWDDFDPVWSPDGRRIAFSSNRAERGAKGHDIFVMDADGRQVQRLTHHAANEYDPSWAGDGRSIFFTGERDGRGELYRVWLHDLKTDRITRGLNRAIMPAVSADGRYLAYAAQTLIEFQIHLINLETGESRQLTSGGGACRPAWSPNGKQVAYVLLDADPSKIDVIDVKTGQRRRLLEDAKLWMYYPEWSPDGRRVAFSVSPKHHQGEDWDLALADADQPGRFVRLTIGIGNDRVPDWTP